MEIIKWATEKGFKLILSAEEAGRLVSAIEMALKLGSFDDGESFEIEIEESK